jgi:hypothetical protein
MQARTSRGKENGGVQWNKANWSQLGRSGSSHPSDMPEFRGIMPEMHRRSTCRDAPRASTCKRHSDFSGHHNRLQSEQLAHPETARRTSMVPVRKVIHSWQGLRMALLAVFATFLVGALLALNLLVIPVRDSQHKLFERCATQRAAGAPAPAVFTVTCVRSVDTLRAAAEELQATQDELTSQALRNARYVLTRADGNAPRPRRRARPGLLRGPTRRHAFAASCSTRSCTAATSCRRRSPGSRRCKAQLPSWRGSGLSRRPLPSRGGRCYPSRQTAATAPRPVPSTAWTDPPSAGGE